MPVRINLKKFVILIGLTLAMGLVLGPVTQAQIPDIEISVGDTTGTAGQPGGISIYLKNYFQSVAGYTLWITLLNPNIMEFETSLQVIPYQTFWVCTDYDQVNPDLCIDSVAASLYYVCQEWDGDNCVDSIQLLGYYECTDWDVEDNCIDSIFHEGYEMTYVEMREAYVGDFDTVGTLTQGWQKVETRSLGDYGQDMLITAIANNPEPPVVSGIPAPQYGLTPLIKINGQIADIPDTDTNRTVNIRIEASILDFFGFSDEDGNAIGIITEEVEDTIFYMCTQWVIPGEECAFWERVEPEPPGGADSMKVYTYLDGHLDTDKVIIKQGSLTVLLGLCGDVTGTSPGEPDGNTDILDIIYLIDDKFKDGPEPGDLAMVDFDCNLMYDILDIIAYIDWKFKGADPISCCPELWQ